MQYCGLDDDNDKKKKERDMLKLDGQSRETVFNIDQQILGIFQGDLISRNEQVCSVGMGSGVSVGWQVGEGKTERLSDVCPDCGAHLARVGYCHSCISCGWGGCN